MISDKYLKEFTELYEQEFGEKLDSAEALKQATALFSLVKMTYKPMTKAEWKKYSTHLDNLDDYC